ncbi:MAG: hypothetical protein EBU88_07475 [Acidobacteria bacterium]|nr:hypothetical protein [Acidobacteriota bacterium]
MKAEDPESYPEAVRKLSESWRHLPVSEQMAPEIEGVVRASSSEPVRIAKKLSGHYVTVGVGIGLLLVALLTVLGGLAFLVWNAGR